MIRCSTRWNIGKYSVEWFAALHAETLEYITRWMIRCITRWNIGIHCTLKHWKTFEWFAALHAKTLEDIALNDSLHYTLKLWNTLHAENLNALHAETFEYITRWMICCITCWNIWIHLNDTLQYTLKHWKI